MRDLLFQPWPWYVAGPVLGLFVPALLVVGNKLFGVSSNLRHACAALAPARVEFFQYDWRRVGGWNFAFAAGMLAGGFIAWQLLGSDAPVAISTSTQADLAALGVRDFDGLVPGDLFSWSGLFSPLGFVLIVGGGFLVGFGTAYAGGCTSGHAIAGLADLQLPSLIAAVAFFAGGMFMTWVVFPLLFQLR